MVLVGEKTLKTSIMKNLSKSQKFARIVSAVEFRSSRTIFLRFTVKLYLGTSDSDSGRTHAVELFCRHSQRVEAVIFAEKLHHGCLIGF